MPYGMKVSNIGKDVMTCDDFDLVMSSEISTLKTLIATTIGPASSYTHNLGYTPIFLYAVIMSGKPLKLNFIGQNPSTAIIEATTTQIENWANSGESQQLYVFYDQL